MMDGVDHEATIDREAHLRRSGMALACLTPEQQSATIERMAFYRRWAKELRRDHLAMIRWHPWPVSAVAAAFTVVAPVAGHGSVRRLRRRGPNLQHRCLRSACGVAGA